MCSNLMRTQLFRLIDRSELFKKFLECRLILRIKKSGLGLSVDVVTIQILREPLPLYEVC